MAMRVSRKIDDVSQESMTEIEDQELSCPLQTVPSPISSLHPNFIVTTMNITGDMHAVNVPRESFPETAAMKVVAMRRSRFSSWMNHESMDLHDSFNDSTMNKGNASQQMNVGA